MFKLRCSMVLSEMSRRNASRNYSWFCIILEDYGKSVCKDSQCKLGAACQTISPNHHICLCPLGSYPPSCKQGVSILISDIFENISKFYSFILKSLERVA